MSKQFSRMDAWRRGEIPFNDSAVESHFEYIENALTAPVLDSRDKTSRRDASKAMHDYIVKANNQSSDSFLETNWEMLLGAIEEAHTEYVAMAAPEKIAAMDALNQQHTQRVINREMPEWEGLASTVGAATES